MLIFGSRYQGTFEIVAKIYWRRPEYARLHCVISSPMFGFFAMMVGGGNGGGSCHGFPFVTRMMLGYGFCIADHLAPHAGWKGVQRSGNCTVIFYLVPGHACVLYRL